jgi:hypothetical protein
MNPIDEYRFKVLRQIGKLKTIQTTFPIWAPTIKNLAGTNPTGQELFDLGDHLSAIFKSNSTATRSQSGASSSGTAWESLVCWYLNMVFHGTGTVVFKPLKAFVPPVLFDAIAVTINNHRQNSESDLICISLNDWALPAIPKRDDLDQQIRTKHGRASLGVIQCKTNWRDNAQIPMLWDFVYTNTFGGTNIGANGFDPAVFRSFTYAFATVPTGKAIPKAQSTPVNRVSGLSGGNFWGHASTQHVARSLKEYAGRNFADSFVDTEGSRIPVADSVKQNVALDPEVLQSYLNFTF